MVMDMTGAGAEREARVLLAASSEPGDESLAALVAEHGAVAVAKELLRGGLRIQPKAGHASARELLDGLEVRRQACGARVIVPEDAEWPSQLDDLTAPPLALWVAGAANLRLCGLRSLSIVGARAATTYGQRVASDVAAEMAERGWAIISGGAYGIDAAAHRGALAAGGVTIAFLAGGVDQPYPRSHDPLFRMIRERGAVVSESPPGEPPRKHRFLERNRLIAALGRGTVVVEAAQRSGARTTATRARDIGRLVMAVPGPVTSAVSAGSNALIKSGDAELVSGFRDVLHEVLEWGRQASGVAVGGGAHLEGGPGQLVEALRRDSATEDELAESLGMPAGEILAILGMWELRGWVRREPHGWEVIQK